MSDVFVLDSPALEAAVRFHSKVEQPKRRPGRNNLKEQPVAAGGTSGMFTVSTFGENGVAVKGGFTDLDSSFFPGIVLENQGLSHNMAVFLTATLKSNTWVLAIEIDHIYAKLDIPGEKISYPLAVFYRDTPSAPVALYQLHCGGRVNFKELYYIDINI